MGVVVIAEPWAAEERKRPRAAVTTTLPERGAGSRASSDGMVGHLRELQRIADRHGRNRAAGTAGDRASVSYVAAELREAGYEVMLQQVRFPFFDERGDPRVRLAGRTSTASRR